MITIVTPCFNNVVTIDAALASVASQSVKHYEHIIVDGGSTDGTLDIINKMKSDRTFVISERDKGPYDAMNKGILMATGDIVGILNADDMFADNNVLDKIAATFQNSDCDACYGDLVYVDRADANKVIRCWKSGQFRPDNFKGSWIPPHPTFYVRRSVYEKHGLYNLNYSLAADYELMLRFIVKHRIKLKYIEDVLVDMRVGGITNKSISNIIRQNIEILRARHAHCVPGTSAGYLVSKAYSRMKQYVGRRRPSPANACGSHLW